jgi:hypothetical protein
MTRNVPSCNVTLSCVLLTIVAGENRKHSGCLSVGSITHHSKRMRRVILSSVACPAA